MTSAMTTRLRLIGLALLLSTATTGISHAQAAGVDALLQQAKYWRSKGREDLAQQALRRAKALDPGSAAVSQAMNAAPAPAPRPAPKPAARTATATKPAPVRSQAPAQSQPARVAAAPARSAPAPTTSANRAGQARVAGFDALEDGNLASAANQFQRALSVNSRDPDALGGLGLVRLRESQFAEAANLLEQASRYGKASQWAEGLSSARFFAGMADARNFVAQGRLADAQSVAEGLIRSGYKEPAPALELLADVYEKQGRYADAADLYRQASQGGGSDDRRLQMRAARGRALAAAANGDDMGATREFQNGLVLDPEDPWIRYEFAEFQIKRGRIPEAESLLRSLVNKGQPDALYAAALINADLGRSTEAARLIDMIPETQRTAPMRSFAIGVKTDSAIARAKAMAAQGQQAQALASLRQLGAMNAVPVGKQAAIANALYDLGDAQGAASVAENAMQGQVSGIDDYEGLIGVLARVGRDDLAQQALQRASTLAGSSAEGQQAYGRMNAALLVSQADRSRQAGRFAEAFDVLQSAYSAAPDNMEVLAGLARLYQSGQMPARAAQTWQLVLARKPGDKEALLGLADTAQAAGDGDLSRRAQNDVLRAFPQDYQVRLSLANVERARGNDRAAMSMLKDARNLYARSQGGTSIDGLAGGNPFAAMTPAGGSNPFRDRAPIAPQQVNPFALGGGTRLPAAQTGYGAAGALAAYGAPAAYGASTGYAAAPSYGSAPGYGSTANYGSAAMAAPSAPYPVTGGYGDAGMDAPTTTYSADPVMAQIQSQIASLAQDSGPRVDVETGYRQRSGEKGLSQLDEIKGSARFSTDAPGGRFYAKAEASVIDAGTPNRSGQARFGRNATIEAQAIVDEVPSVFPTTETQNASGVAFSAGYESDSVQVEGGTTPVGMGKTKPTFRAAVSPKVGEALRLTAFAEHKPVTDSIVSYAGTRDPVTGERWGQVMRTAGGAGMSYDHEGSGVYAEGRYYRFRGTNVARNDGFEANVGGYLRAYRGQHSALTVGLNVNYQGYDKSQNYFTFGHGGYFSPQTFISVGFPVNYTMEDDRIDLRASFTPGFQSYSQDQTALYPLDPTLQAQLDALKAENNDVRSYYDSISKTGFALSSDVSLYYKISPTTRIGGEASYNTFGSYDEFRSLLGVRQNFGSTGR
ncbi:cellulose biosynthesis protein BcsC [Novosphingobium sp. ST904]|uniref:cellulose biosynthesis protein BcsC n=1 Tax=Novosphingobium sp. ST904 TaxID=1684385 RepID=UPI00104778CE|nr:cellulose biosynthesis protein BcsC [Novosphingobium sp. ST904]TCM42161.1 Tfp pilus assembly protein PilF [Novosphingobium sp. ST904]